MIESIEPTECKYWSDGFCLVSSKKCFLPLHHDGWGDCRLYEPKRIIPKCPVCGKPMVNAYDSICNKTSPYLWRTTCGHMKDKILSRG